MIDYYVYDIETYPNIFTVAMERFNTGERWLFEMSVRRNDAQLLLDGLNYLERRTDVAMVGYNSIGFDYPIVHQFWNGNGSTGYWEAFQKCQQIIGSRNAFEHTIWDSDWRIPQIDLFKIHHFDNAAKRTGLKQIEFNMRVPNIQDLPFPPGTELASWQMDELIRYNMEGDVANTREFLRESLEAIEFRRTFGSKYLNYNDTKVGKQYFIGQLESAGIATRDSDNQPIQTHRPFIDLNDAVFNYIDFRSPEFTRILHWFKQQQITQTKGIFSEIECTLNDFKYVFGLGGIHGSVESQTVYSDDEWIIEDWDVASYYPNLAIKNRVHPYHLGAKFCDIYEDVYQQRKQHPKGSAPNAVMKLALNGVYGDSNNKYSPFYDPLYTMTITINGQLLLCKLAEELQVVPGLQMIQINTDGLTIRYPRRAQQSVHTICEWWEGFTHLELENVEYQRMHIRDVNNYLAVKPDGGVKRKGAYEYEREHHQNHSALVVPKAAEKVLVEGLSIHDAVLSHTDIFDYCLRVKAPVLQLDGADQQRTCRYYVSTVGGTLKSVKPPPAGMRVGDYKKKQGITNAEYWQANQTGVHNPQIHTKNMSTYGDLVSEVEKGWQVTVCNDMMDAVNPINYEYYFERVRKLVEPLL